MNSVTFANVSDQRCIYLKYITGGGRVTKCWYKHPHRCPLVPLAVAIQNSLLRRTAHSICLIHKDLPNYKINFKPVCMEISHNVRNTKYAVTNDNWPQHSYFTSIRRLITRQVNQQLKARFIEADYNRNVLHGNWTKAIITCRKYN